MLPSSQNRNTLHRVEWMNILHKGYIPHSSTLRRSSCSVCTTHIHVLKLVEVRVLLDDLLGLLADELGEGVDGALPAVLPLRHDPVPHVLQRRVLRDVEPRTQAGKMITNIGM